MTLPPCHSRRLVELTGTVFFCAHPGHHSVSNLVTRETCHSCSLWQLPSPPEFRQFPPAPPSVRLSPCQYLGEQNGLRDCPSCGGTVRLKVFACVHPRHQETTLAECLQCPDYSAQQTDAGLAT